jgi:exodeoxyribonuclease VII large subunit
MEDLWCFNDETLARAIAACKKPVISAVGHETDTTISDYVADLRAPTPSAAAELAVYAWREVEIGLRECAYDLGQHMKNRLHLHRMKLERYQMLLQHTSPEDVLRQKRLYLTECQDKLQMMMERRVTDARHRLEIYVEEMKGLSPLQKLQSGYTYVTDGEGHHIESISRLEAGQPLTLTFADGQADVTVNQVTKNAPLTARK